MRLFWMRKSHLIAALCNIDSCLLGYFRVEKHPSYSRINKVTHFLQRPLLIHWQVQGSLKHLLTPNSQCLGSTLRPSYTQHHTTRIPTRQYESEKTCPTRPAKRHWVELKCKPTATKRLCAMRIADFPIAYWKCYRISRNIIPQDMLSFIF